MWGEMNVKTINEKLDFKGVTTEIATGWRTKKIKFVKKEFGVATIVIIGNYGKP